MLPLWAIAMLLLCGCQERLHMVLTSTHIRSSRTAECDATCCLLHPTHKFRASPASSCVVFCHLLHGSADFEGGGCATLTDLFNARMDKYGPKGPLYVMDDDDNVDYKSTKPTGKWFLASELYVEDGVTLEVHGTDIGGDCDALRIQSEGSKFHEIRAHGGNLHFENTIVTSWDTSIKGPTDDYKNGRSYINCVSEKAPKVSCEGAAKNNMGECRMDIINSEMGYLGWADSESYGLTWKVRGYCVDGSNPEVFEDTNVYGDIQSSDIHHMYYGMVSLLLVGCSVVCARCGGV